MEEILKELVRNAPEAAAILITVVLFLKAMTKRDELLKTLREESHDRANELFAQNLNLYNALKETLDVNSKVLSRVEKVLDKYVNGKVT